MGNLLSCRPPAGTATVFLPDGEARRLKSPVTATAADLMLDHPCHFVAELTGHSPFPLPADHRLEVRKAYVMLPMAAGKVLGGSQSLPNGLPEEMGSLLQRQHSLKGWKPSLGTIEERPLEKKIPHWLF